MRSEWQQPFYVVDRGGISSKAHTLEAHTAHRSVLSGRGGALPAGGAADVYMGGAAYTLRTVWVCVQVRAELRNMEDRMHATTQLEAEVAETCAKLAAAEDRAASAEVATEVCSLLAGALEARGCPCGCIHQ